MKDIRELMVKEQSVCLLSGKAFSEKPKKRVRKKKTGEQG